jgi:hypothetical protein
MPPRLSLILLLVCLPTVSSAQTGHDIRDRVHPDGILDEYSRCEWVLDDSTSVIETGNDSRWGSNNDIKRIALTWDDYNLYIGVNARVADGTVIVLCDLSCGGLGDLSDFRLLRRNIVLTNLSVDLLLWHHRPGGTSEAAVVSCTGTDVLEDGEDFEAAFGTGTSVPGGFEAVVPWSELGDFVLAGGALQLPRRNMRLRLLACISGGDGTGVGDVAPDSGIILDSDSTRTATLDNFLDVELDRDGDGFLDVGSCPRDAVSFARINTGEAYSPQVNLRIDRKVFSPDKGEKIRFKVSSAGGGGATALASASIFSSSGRLVRVLFSGRELKTGNSGTLSSAWDGRDAGGSPAAGGIYMIVLEISSSGRGRSQIARKAFALIR